LKKRKMFKILGYILYYTNYLINFLILYFQANINK
jgi:hypothetical protein